MTTKTRVIIILCAVLVLNVAAVIAYVKLAPKGDVPSDQTSAKAGGDVPGGEGQPDVESTYEGGSDVPKSTAVEEGKPADAPYGTLVIGDREYELTSEEAGEIASLLIELDYSKDKICRCVPDYTFRIYPGYRKLPSSLEDPANSGPEIAFGVKISEGESYSRCVAGQESLDAAVSAKLAAIIENAKNR